MQYKFDFTISQYLTIKALFNCTEQSVSRLTLQHVFFQHKKSTFTSTDGNVLRQEIIEVKDAPAVDLLLSKKDFLMTKAQLKMQGSFVAVTVLENMLQGADFTYPNYEMVIPHSDDYNTPQAVIAIGSTVLEKLISTFTDDVVFAFKFGPKHISAITVLTSPKEGKTHPYVFRGIVMPCRIFEGQGITIMKEGK